MVADTGKRIGSKRKICPVCGTFIPGYRTTFIASNSSRWRQILIVGLFLLAVILSALSGALIHALRPDLFGLINEADETAEALVAEYQSLESRNQELKAVVESLEARLIIFEQPKADDILEIDSLVRVRDLDPTIIVDLRYATEDNFTGIKLYPIALCLLRRGTAEKLVAAQTDFVADGYRLKVWDAYRPLGVQEELWAVVSDPKYVAPPYVGSNHNRGAAVDVTLVDGNGEELLMPTKFDDFSPKASRSYPDMHEEARNNMEYLTKIMVNNGFTPIESEWWHFNDSDIQDYGLLDISLEEFASIYFSR